MATAQITLQVDAETARQFQNASVEEKARLQMIFQTLLRQRSQGNLDSMFAIMDKIGNDAKKNGLTEEIFHSIMNEKE